MAPNMVRLVKVWEGCEEKGEENSSCLAKRQMPVTIDDDLTMIMALDDNCVACGDDKPTDTQDRNNFLKNYKRLEVFLIYLCNFDNIYCLASAKKQPMPA